MANTVRKATKIGTAPAEPAKRGRPKTPVVYVLNGQPAQFPPMDMLNRSAHRMVLDSTATVRTRNAWHRMERGIIEWTDKHGPLMTVAEWDELAESKRVRFRHHVDDDAYLLQAERLSVAV